MADLWRNVHSEHGVLTSPSSTLSSRPHIFSLTVSGPCISLHVSHDHETFILCHHALKFQFLLFRVSYKWMIISKILLTFHSSWCSDSPLCFIKKATIKCKDKKTKIQTWPQTPDKNLCRSEKDINAKQ